MNRLIENARKRAWGLAFMAEVADLEGRPAWVRMNRAEVNQIANTLNALTVIAQDRLDTMVLQAQRQQPTYVYDVDGRYGKGLVDLVRPFQRRHDEACASALALGLQMTVMKWWRDGWMKRYMEVCHRTADLVKKLDGEREYVFKLEDKRSEASKLAGERKREIDALKEQVEGWKRRYEAKVYHNE